MSMQSWSVVCAKGTRTFHIRRGLIPSAPQAEAIRTPSSYSQDVCSLQEELNFHVVSTDLLTLNPGRFLYFILSKHEHSNDLGKDTYLALVFDASGSNAQSVIWKWDSLVLSYGYCLTSYSSECSPSVPMVWILIEMYYAHNLWAVVQVQLSRLSHTMHSQWVGAWCHIKGMIWHSHLLGLCQLSSLAQSCHYWKCCPPSWCK